MWKNIQEYDCGETLPALIAVEEIPEDTYGEKCAYVYDEADTFLFNQPKATEKILNDHMSKESICVFLTATAF